MNNINSKAIGKVEYSGQFLSTLSKSLEIPGMNKTIFQFLTFSDISSLRLTKKSIYIASENHFWRPMYVRYFGLYNHEKAESAEEWKKLIKESQHDFECIIHNPGIDISPPRQTHTSFPTTYTIEHLYQENVLTNELFQSFQLSDKNTNLQAVNNITLSSSYHVLSISDHPRRFSCINAIYLQGTSELRLNSDAEKSEKITLLEKKFNHRLNVLIEDAINYNLDIASTFCSSIKDKIDGLLNSRKKGRLEFKFLMDKNHRLHIDGNGMGIETCYLDINSNFAVKYMYLRSHCQPGTTHQLIHNTVCGIVSRKLTQQFCNLKIIDESEEKLTKESVESKTKDT